MAYAVADQKGNWTQSYMTREQAVSSMRLSYHKLGPIKELANGCFQMPTGEVLQLRVVCVQPDTYDRVEHL